MRYIYVSLYLLLPLIHAARQANEVQIKASINSTGACPAEHIVSWISIATPRPSLTLKYKLFCCGKKNKELCASPVKYQQQLKTLKCCEQLSNHYGVLLSCNITSALQRFKIYQPHTWPPQPLVALYSVFEVRSRDGSANNTWYSHHKFDLGLRKIICTTPSNFNATLDGENVMFRWAMPPRMYCESFEFTLRYSVVQDSCSNDSNQTGTVGTVQYHKSNLQNQTFTKIVPVSLLTSFRDYLFNLKCNMFGDYESTPALVRVKRLSRVPLVAPRDLLLQKQKNFKEKRNVTLTWEAPSALCPAEWNGRPVNFLLRYFKTRTSSSDATIPNQENDVSLSNDVTSVSLNPSSNKVTISDLDRYQEYNVSLAMCTEAGCGQNSKTHIAADPEPTRRVERKTNNGATIWVIVSSLLFTGGLVTIVVVILVLNISKRRSTEESEGPAQPSLEGRVEGISPYNPYSAPTIPQTQDDDVYVDSFPLLLED